jgi:hypothetical protein
VQPYRFNGTRASDSGARRLLMQHLADPDVYLVIP